MTNSPQIEQGANSENVENATLVHDIESLIDEEEAKEKALDGSKEEKPNESQDEPAEETPTEASDSEASDSEAREEKPEETGAELEPHPLWDKQTQERFKTLDRETQKFLLDTTVNWQRGYNEKFQQIAEKRKELEALEQAIEPIKPLAENAGIAPSEAVAMISNHLQNIARDPKQGAVALLHELGIDPAELTGVEIKQPDPLTQQALEEARIARQQVEQLQQANLSAQEQQLVRQIEEFAQAADEQGNLLHPDFEQLQPTMAQILEAGLAQDLDTAYRMAKFHVSPQESQQSPATGTVTRTTTAKKAAKNVRKTKPATTPSKQKDLRSEIADFLEDF